MNNLPIDRSDRLAALLIVIAYPYKYRLWSKIVSLVTYQVPISTPIRQFLNSNLSKQSICCPGALK